MFWNKSDPSIHEVLSWSNCRFEYQVLHFSVEPITTPWVRTGKVLEKSQNTENGSLCLSDRRKANLEQPEQCVKLWDINPRNCTRIRDGEHISAVRNNIATDATLKVTQTPYSILGGAGGPENFKKTTTNSTYCPVTKNSGTHGYFPHQRVRKKAPELPRPENLCATREAKRMENSRIQALNTQQFLEKDKIRTKEKQLEDDKLRDIISSACVGRSAYADAAEANLIKIWNAEKRQNIRRTHEMLTTTNVSPETKLRTEIFPKRDPSSVYVRNNGMEVGRNVEYASRDLRKIPWFGQLHTDMGKKELAKLKAEGMIDTDHFINYDPPVVHIVPPCPLEIYGGGQARNQSCTNKPPPIILDSTFSATDGEPVELSNEFPLECIGTYSNGTCNNDSNEDCADTFSLASYTSLEPRCLESFNYDCFMMQAQNVEFEDVVQGSFHQANIPESYAAEGAAGNQCTAMVAAAAAYSKCKPLSSWRRQDMDFVVRAGNNYYNAVRPLSNDEYLLPADVGGEISLAGRRILIVPYEDESWVGMRNDFGPAEVGMSMLNSIQAFLDSHFTFAFITTANYTMGIIKTADAVFYFDSHSQGPQGQKLPEGGASCLVRFAHVTSAANISNLIHENVAVHPENRVRIVENNEMLEFQFTITPFDVIDEDEDSLIPTTISSNAERNSSQHFSGCALRTNSGDLTDYQHLPSHSTPNKRPAPGLFSPTCTSPCMRTDSVPYHSEISLSPINYHTHHQMTTPNSACSISSGGTAFLDQCPLDKIASTSCGDKLEDFDDLSLNQIRSITKRVKAVGRIDSFETQKICRKHIREFTTRFKDYQKTKGCANPFGVHSTRKTGRVVTEAQLRTFNGFPHIVAGMFLCTSCRSRVAIECSGTGRTANRFAQSESYDLTQSEISFLRESSTPPHSPLVAGESPLGSVYEAESPFQKLKSTLTSLKVTPPHRHQTTGKRKRILTRTFVKARKALSESFKELGELMEPKEKSVKTSDPVCNACNSLVDDLKSKFSYELPKTERYKILTCIPKSKTLEDIVSQFGCSLYEARQAKQLVKSSGAFTAPPRRPKRGLSEHLKKKVLDFYLDTNNSRPLPGIRDTILIPDESGGGRIRVAKQLVLMSSVELYYSFKIETGEDLSYTSFVKLRPKQCKWAGPCGHHNSCTCIIHANFEFLMEVCGKYGKAREILKEFACDTSSVDCMLGFCPNCPSENSTDALLCGIDPDDELRFTVWETTDRCNLTDLTETGSDFIERVQRYLPLMKTHSFIHEQQKAFVNSLKTKLVSEPNSCMVQLDFSENFTFVIQDAVQGYRWTNAQCTIHPFYVTRLDPETNELMSKAFVIISECLTHDANAVALYLKRFIERLKSEFSVRKIYYISDGCAGQYKNYKNFTNLLFHEEEYEVEAEWHFTATAHGKSSCDASGAVTKKGAKVSCLRDGTRIRNSLEMYHFCQNTLASQTVDYMHVSTEEVINNTILSKLEERYSATKTIPGTRCYHSFKPKEAHIIELKKFSSSTTFVDHVMIPLHSSAQTTPLQVHRYFVGQYVAVRIGTRVQIGVIKSIDESTTTFDVSFMKKSGRMNSYTWPNVENVHSVLHADISTPVEAPVTETGRIYRLSDADWDLLGRLDPGLLL